MDSITLTTTDWTYVDRERWEFTMFSDDDIFISYKPSSWFVSLPVGVQISLKAKWIYIRWAIWTKVSFI